MIKLEQKLTLKLKSKKYKKLQCRQHKVSHNLHAELHSTPRKGCPSEFRKDVRKAGMTELPYTEESVMRRLDTPERDRQTDIRTDGQAELLCWRKRESKVASKNQQSISRRQSWRVWELQFISSSGSETFGHIYRNYLKNETETTLCKKVHPSAFRNN